MISKSSSDTNFGWSMKTHQEILKHAFDTGSLDISKHHRNILHDFIIMPDKDEMNSFGSGHFCFGIPGNFRENLSMIFAEKPNKFIGGKKSFLDILIEKKIIPTNTLSFSDNSGKWNLLSRVMKHSYEAAEAAVDGHKHKSLEKFGRLEHYLAHDMLVPLHSESGSLFQKTFDIVMHLEYEDNHVEKNIDKFLSRSKPLKYKPKSEIKTLQDWMLFVFDIFENNINFSQRPEVQISAKNKSVWDKITSQIIPKAVYSTQELLEGFDQFMINQQGKKFSYYS